MGIPPIAKSPGLRTVDVHNNKFNDAGYIAGERVTVNIEGNRFTKLPTSWRELPDVLALDMADNLISSWPAFGAHPLDSNCGFPFIAPKADWPILERIGLDNNP